MVKDALEAADILKKDKISARVINMHTIKPLDEEIIIKAAKQTKGIVVCEEHSTVGGLGSAVDDVALEHCPTRLLRIGIKDKFGQSGSPADLLKKYELTAQDIAKKVKKVLKQQICRV